MKFTNKQMRFIVLVLMILVIVGIQFISLDLFKIVFTLIGCAAFGTWCRRFSDKHWPVEK